MDHYKRSLEKDPNNHETFMNMGAIYEAQKSYKEALEAYKQSQQLNPDNAKAQEGLERIEKLMDAAD